MNENIYLKSITYTLPRLLAIYDNNPISKTYGLGDRYYWAWKLTDFSNGTFQAAAHGLAILLIEKKLSETFDDNKILKLIDAIFHATHRLQRSNGSLEEAFPYESSYCVTALVAYDLISAILYLKNKISAGKVEEYIATIKPMIVFLLKNEETHAFISNHLAVACAALYKWHALTSEAVEPTAKVILDSILDKQSDEGWFLEYEAADPGYQTLCTYYLADLHKLRPDLNLLPALKRSIEFIQYFVHPDGSFAGIYGSRNTRFYYPAGFEILADEIPEARSIALFMRKAISEQRVVTLDSMDAENLIPMFNAYCLAAVYQTDNEDIERIPQLPCLSTNNFQKNFTQAGLFVHNNPNNYIIINYKKGGVCYAFNRVNRSIAINTGIVAKNRSGCLYTSQAYNINNEVKIDDNSLQITSPLVDYKQPLPTASSFIVLRVLNISLMRIKWFLAWMKKTMVTILITRKKYSSVCNQRTITFDPEIQIEDVLLNNDSDLKYERHITEFSAIHMASQGYWQTQDTGRYKF